MLVYLLLYSRLWGWRTVIFQLSGFGSWILLDSLVGSFQTWGSPNMGPIYDDPYHKDLEKGPELLETLF